LSAFRLEGLVFVYEGFVGFAGALGELDVHTERIVSLSAHPERKV